MKSIVVLLCFPFWAAAQTIHVKGKNIVYEGMVTLPSSSSAGTPASVDAALKAALEKGTMQITGIAAQNTVRARGDVPLNTLFPIVRRLHFTLQLTPAEKGFSYRIDSVYVTEKLRGGKLQVISAKELVEGREQYGTAAVANEKLLNEIDLRIQKLLSLLQCTLQKESLLSN